MREQGRKYSCHLSSGKLIRDREDYLICEELDVDRQSHGTQAIYAPSDLNYVSISRLVPTGSITQHEVFVPFQLNHGSPANDSA